MVWPRQPQEARSRTARTRVRQLVSAGKLADDLGAAAGLAEGALDEVGVPEAVLVLSREPQVGGESVAVGEQAFHRRGIDRRVLVGRLGDAGVDDLGEPGAGLGLELSGADDDPVGVLDLGPHPGRDLRRDVFSPVG